MCTVSQIYRLGQQRWPRPEPYRPYTPHTPLADEIHEIRRYLELILKAKEFDEATGQPDCDDKTKRPWLQALERRLSLLEDTVMKLKADK